MLLKRFKKFVAQEKLFTPSDKLLLALSGGVDSMVLLHLCKQSGFDIAVAHVNFKLRGKEANHNEALVKDTCKLWGISCHTQFFNTKKYAASNKLSIQEAARELRYRYFFNLCHEKGYTKILTAHHASDNIETFFINLLRGSGIKGLSGIPLQRQEIVRPLLFASRQEIETYAKKHLLPIAEDSSNASDAYLRNKIRHHLIPALNDVEPDAGKYMNKSITHLNNEKELLLELYEKAFAPLLVSKKDYQIIDKTALLKYKQAETMLFFFLSSFGFNATQVSSILQNRKNKSGVFFETESHRLLINRNELILTPKKTVKKIPAKLISKPEDALLEPLPLHIEQRDPSSMVDYKNAGLYEAYLDAQKVLFPLTLRLWEHGDEIIPLGMNKRKKVSDILTDKKASALDKEQCYVLSDKQKRIIWIPGYTISQYCKIDTATLQILYFKAQYI